MIFFLNLLLMLFVLYILWRIAEALTSMSEAHQRFADQVERAVSKMIQFRREDRGEDLGDQEDDRYRGL
jgi:hypothetical protein